MWCSDHCYSLSIARLLFDYRICSEKWHFFMNPAAVIRITMYSVSLSVLCWHSFRFYDGFAPTRHALTSLCQFLTGISFHPILSISKSLFSLVGFLSFVKRFSLAHKFLIGLKSVDWAGHCITSTSLFFKIFGDDPTGVFWIVVMLELITTRA